MGNGGKAVLVVAAWTLIAIDFVMVLGCMALQGAWAWQLMALGALHLPALPLLASADRAD